MLYHCLLIEVSKQGSFWGALPEMKPYFKRGPARASDVECKSALKIARAGMFAIQMALN